jgi:type I restriction enzyme S subunit
MSKFRACKWGDLATIEYGKGLRGYQDADGPFPVYGTNGQIGWHKEPLCPHPGVIIGRKGAYRGIHYSKKPFYVIDTAFYLELTSDLVDTKWAYYQLLDFDINNLDSGSAIPSTSREAFYQIPVRLPPLPTQRKIAALLSTYDDLIENNTRRIAILEDMAQAIYREWFVHFRFPGQEGARRLSLEWERLEIGDLPIQIIDGDRSSRYPKRHELQDEGILFLNTTNIRNNRLDLGKANFITHEKFAQLRKGRLQPLDIVMTTRGSIGKVALFNCEYSTGFINAQMLILRTDDDRVMDQFFLFYSLSADEFQDAVRNFASGAAQPQIPIKDLSRIEIACPPIEIQHRFSQIVRRMNRLIKCLQAKNKILRRSRDLLLPRLVSGELDVSELDIDTGAPDT